MEQISTRPDLRVEQPETSLLDTFEARFNTRSICEYHIKPRTKDNISIKYTYFEDVRPFHSTLQRARTNISQSKPCLSQAEVESLRTVLAVTDAISTASDLTSHSISSFYQTLTHLAATENIESTLLVLPTTSKLKKSKIQKSHSQANSGLKRRDENPLELTSDDQRVSAHPGFYDPFANEADRSTTVAKGNHSNANFTLPRVVPQCFTSESACTNTTNSCMGHGKCVKSSGNCYKCKCSRTIIRTNEDGSTKSVQWGGNACQKKDVSTEFILFASFGVFFTAVVAGGIGLLYSMGAQELPSVIGAGVVGPRAQR